MKAMWFCFGVLFFVLVAAMPLIVYWFLTSVVVLMMSEYAASQIRLPIFLTGAILAAGFTAAASQCFNTFFKQMDRKS